jgi:predicted Zn-dependent protease
MKKSWLYTPLAVAMTVMVALVACSTSPTGRRQLLLLPESQLAQMGTATFQDMQKKIPQTKDGKQSRYVNCIADGIIQQLAEKRAWEVSVFDSKEVNAFALPGGKIGVYNGMFAVAKNQDQLAAVMAHEVSHVLAQHSNERASMSELQNIGVAIASSQTGVSPELIGLGSQLFFALPYSRKHETEADLLGLELMAKAGFDPRQAVDLWVNMGKASGGGKPPELMSTHPSDQTRIQQIQEKLPVVMPLYEQAKASGRKPACRL